MAHLRSIPSLARRGRTAALAAAVWLFAVTASPAQIVSLTSKPTALSYLFASASDGQKQAIIALVNEGPATNFTALSDKDWVTVQPNLGPIPANGEAALIVGVIPNDLVYGTHTANITVTAPDRAPLVIPVTATISYTDAVRLTAASVSLTGIAGSTTKSTAEVSLLGTATPTGYSTISSQPWLRVAPAAGTVPANGELKLLVEVDPSAMQPGLHNAAVTIVTPSKTLALVVLVTLTTAELYTVAPTAAEIQIVSGKTPPPRNFVVKRVAGGTPAIATPSQSANGWLSATPGAAGSGLFSVRVDPARIPALPDTGTVTVRDAATAAPGVTLPVRVVRARPTVYSFAQVADGGGFSTAITLVNPTADTVRATLRFRRNLQKGDWTTDDWRPAMVNDATIESLVIGSNSSITVETAGGGDTTISGWVEMTSAAPVRGFAVFRQKTYTGQTQEAAVPMNATPTQHVMLPFNNTAGQTTSVALANLSALETCAVEYVLRDAAGTVNATGTLLTLPLQGHAAFALRDLLPATAGARGTVELSASGGLLSAVALRFHPGGAYTSFETQPDPGTATRKYAPQVADGGGFTTELTLVNQGTAPATVNIRFRRSLADTANATAAWDVGIDPSGGATALTGVTVPVGASYTVRTSGAPLETSSGLAEVETTQPLGGFVVFRLARTDFPVQEATVPLDVPHTTGFTLPYDNASGFVTGVAIVNPSAAAAARVDVTVRDRYGVVAGTATINLPALGHRAFEMPRELPVSAGQPGIAEFRVVSGSVSAIGLRFSPAGPFTSFQPQWW